MITPLLLAFAVIFLALSEVTALAIECPPHPAQTNKDWDAEINVGIAKFKKLSGAELKAGIRTTTQELLSKIPDAGMIYMEQVMYATYCSAVRDDKDIKEAEKAQRIRDYNAEVRRALHPEISDQKQPPPNPSPRMQRSKIKKTVPQTQSAPSTSSQPAITQQSGGANSPNIVNQNTFIISPGNSAPQINPRDGPQFKLYFRCDVTVLPKITEEGLKMLFVRPRAPMPIGSPGSPASSFYEPLDFGSPNRLSDPEQKRGMGHKCQVKNHGKTAVSNVIVSFAIRYFELIPDTKNPKAYTAGSIKSTLEWPIKFDVLGQGEAISFYVINVSSQYLAAINTPLCADLEALGETERHRVTLSTPYGKGTYGFELRPLTNPQARGFAYDPLPR